MGDIIKIDASKLAFKPEFLSAAKITVRIETLGRHYPMSRDQIISAIERGVHHDKINSWFTQKSIKLATKTKKTNNESEN